MKKIQYMLACITAAVLSGILGGCTSQYLDDVPELPDRPMVSNLQANPEGFDLILQWTLPQTNLKISNVTVSRINNEGQATNTWTLDATATSYTIVGAPLGESVGYTVKVLYADGYSSIGQTVYAELPMRELAPASDLKATVERRTVTLSWTMPQADYITGVRVYTTSNPEGAMVINEPVTSVEMKSQPMEETLTYNVELIYADNYFAAPAQVDAYVDFVPTMAGFLLLANSISDLPDDDEQAAALWFAQQSDVTFVTVDQLSTLDPEEVSVLWIMVDRVGLNEGWQNLPAPLAEQTTLDALKAYSAAGGSLYLSNMATQLTAPLGIVPMDMAPNLFASGEGGTGDDIWTINPHLGWMFRDNGQQGYYDHADAVIFNGITMEVVNGYPYESIPLIGPGQREDHNCMWDCNVYGPGNQIDVIKNFEITTNSLVYATWGHVQDHCVAGLVEFMPNMEHGRCIANGFAAYEWNQNSSPNPYQHNVEKLTSNILEYLK